MEKEYIFFPSILKALFKITEMFHCFFLASTVEVWIKWKSCVNFIQARDHMKRLDFSFFARSLYRNWNLYAPSYYS